MIVLNCVSSLASSPVSNKANHVTHNGRHTGLSCVSCCAQGYLAKADSGTRKAAMLYPPSCVPWHRVSMPKERSPFFPLIFIEAPSACQAVHLQGCLYLAGRSFAPLSNSSGAIWASESPANGAAPYPLPRWVFHRWAQVKHGHCLPLDWSVTITLKYRIYWLN